MYTLPSTLFTIYTLHYVYVQVFRKKIKRAKPKAEGGKKKGDGEGGAVEEEDEDSGQESDSDFLRFVALCFYRGLDIISASSLQLLRGGE